MHEEGEVLGRQTKDTAADTQNVSMQAHTKDREPE